MKGCTFGRILPSGRFSWGYSLYLGKDSTGKKLRLFESGFKREKDAQDALTKALTEKDANTLVKPDPRIFRAFMDEWLRKHAARYCSPKTAERYRQLIDYTMPHIGAVPLQDLSAITLERLYNRLKDAGDWNRKAKLARPLSVKTVRNIAGVVHTALKTAVRWKLLNLNPADAVQLPRWQRREAKALESDSIARYLHATHSSPGMYEILPLRLRPGTGEANCSPYSGRTSIRSTAWCKSRSLWNRPPRACGSSPPRARNPAQSRCRPLLLML